MAHKLAITGHKLVFICDTLQRNLSNVVLKQLLFEASANLCTSLKAYMIRLKLLDANANVVESIDCVFDAAVRFKSIILKYYFKSF